MIGFKSRVEYEIIFFFLFNIVTIGLKIFNLKKSRLKAYAFIRLQY